MFKVGDYVELARPLAPQFKGARGTVTVVKLDTVHIKWDLGTDYNLAPDQRSHKFDLVPGLSIETVEGIGKEIISTLAARGKQYDKDGTKERSMAKTVEAFNAITGKDLTAVEGWAFMQVLKQVRFFSNTSAPHRDSLIDNGAYALLQAEEALQCQKK